MAAHVIVKAILKSKSVMFSSSCFWPASIAVIQRKAFHTSAQDLVQQNGSDTNSSSSSEEKDSVQDKKRRILQAALPFVHDLGWSLEAIKGGARASGYPITSHGLFPSGGVELVTYFYLECNKDLVSTMKEWNEDAEADSSTKKTRGTFLKDALWYRLQLNTPYIARWPQALGLLALPQNATRSWELLAHMVDDIWFHEGNQSTDFEWYMKRVALAGIYQSSELFLLQDSSEGCSETKKFLERCLDKAWNFSEMSKKITSTR